MDQARAGLSALQLAGPQESARRVAIGLHGTQSEENLCPKRCLIPTKNHPQLACKKKTDPAHDSEQFARSSKPCNAPPNSSVGQTPSGFFRWPERRLICCIPQTLTWN